MACVCLATPGTDACDAVGGAFRPECREWVGLSERRFQPFQHVTRVVHSVNSARATSCNSRSPAFCRLFQITLPNESWGPTFASWGNSSTLRRKIFSIATQQNRIFLAHRDGAQALFPSAASGTRHAARGRIPRRANHWLCPPLNGRALKLLPVQF